MGTEGQASGAVATWRPTAQSYFSLTAFSLSLCVAAAAVLGVTKSAALVGVTVGLAALVGVLLAVMITRKRVAAALAEAERPTLGNWPGTDADRRQLRHRGRVRTARSTAMALVLGALCGFYPILGVACIGGGLAGAVAAGIVVRTVVAYEAAHDVTVLSASEPGSALRRRLHFGLAPGRW